MVSNGTYLQAEGIVQALPLYVQGHLLQFLAYVLPVTGSDIILGAAWLLTLGPHIVDYSTSTIKFYLGNEFITLHGIS